MTSDILRGAFDMHVSEKIIIGARAIGCFSTDGAYLRLDIFLFFASPLTEAYSKK